MQAEPSHPVAPSRTPPVSTARRDNRRVAVVTVGFSKVGSRSVLGDGAAEALQRDGFGLGAAAAAGVEPVDRGELVVGEVEVEDVEVLRDPGRLGRLRDHRAALLDAPAQHHLGRALAVRLGDAGDDRVLQGAGVLTVAVEGDATDRRPGLGQDVVLGVLGLHLGLLEVGVDLDLVDRRHHRRHVQAAG